MNIGKTVTKLWQSLRKSESNLENTSSSIEPVAYVNSKTPEGVLILNYSRNFLYLRSCALGLIPIRDALPDTLSEISELDSLEKQKYLDLLLEWGNHYESIKKRIKPKFNSEPKMKDVDIILRSYIGKSEEYKDLVVDEAVFNREGNPSEDFAKIAAETVRDDLVSLRGDLSYGLLKTGFEISIQSQLDRFDYIYSNLLGALTK